LPFAIFLNAIG